MSNQHVSNHSFARRCCVAVSILATGAGVIAFAPTQPAEAAAVVPQDGLYHVSSPHRLLDTRRTGGAVAAGKTVTIPRSVLTAAGLPTTGVQSVVVNLTVTGTTGTGWGTIFSGSTVPATSNINFSKGWTGAVSSTVALASNSGLSIKVGGTGLSTQVIVDLEGWYSNSTYTPSTGSGLQIGDPERWVDTRTDGGPLPAQSWDTIGMSWDATGDWAGTTPTAVIVNLTALGAKGSGSLSLWNGDENAWPTTSSVNFAKGETSPNTAIVPVRKESDGSYSFGVANTGGQAVNYLVDVLGFYYTGAVMPTFKHVVVAPKRVMSFASIGSNKTASVTLPAAVGDAKVTGGIEGVLTGYRPTSGGYQTIWDGLGAMPKTSNLNSVNGGIRANGFLVRENSDDSLGLTVFNSAGTIKAIVDVTGRFDWTGTISSAVAAQKRQLPARVATTSAHRVIGRR